MGQDTDQIRDEIEATRSRMGDTVEAIGYKADVPSRVRDSVNERISSVKGSIGDAVGNTKDAVFGKVSDMSNSASDAIADARSGSADASASTRRTVSMAMENPLGLAIGALALGILAGLLIPVTDIERERLGPVRDELAAVHKRWLRMRSMPASPCLTIRSLRQPIRLKNTARKSSKMPFPERRSKERLQKRDLSLRRSPSARSSQYSSCRASDDEARQVLRRLVDGRRRTLRAAPVLPAR